MATRTNNFRRSHYAQMVMTTVMRCAVYCFVLCFTVQFSVILSFNGCRVSFPGVKRLGLGVDQEPPYRAEVSVGRSIPLLSPLCLQWHVRGDLYLYRYVLSCCIMKNMCITWCNALWCDMICYGKLCDINIHSSRTVLLILKPLMMRSSTQFLFS